MLSVIVYGRNDSHGYNLHKRAAVSLNALAEVMSDPDDEILFVDYNTPDDHPTFPEAIRDTLTAKARGLIRVLRVRPDDHAELRLRTHLVALEAQSRNVALRRSNPRNRWILYTNSDVILVPRDRAESLSDILRGLPDGFYETPRFELPEMLWEGALDRSDPVANIEKLRGWAPRFHLNQVVHNNLPMRYDALGDFQVTLREDMFAIHGFDEAMVLGWHCDSNLAARLTLYRGAAETLIDKVYAYHCDHTRVAAANNRGQQTRMNSQTRFIWDVATPFLPAQAESWGWPDRDIEELRLDRDSAYSRYSAGIDAAITPATEPYRTTTIEWNTYQDLTYDLPHTLPFVCDQVLTYPRNANVMIMATRAQFVRQFAAAWTAMGFSGVLLLPAECEGMPTNIPGTEVGPFQEFLRRADLFIVEFGFASQRPDEPIRTGRRASESDKQRLDVVEQLFCRAAASEAQTRPQTRQTARRFVGVNVIYNRQSKIFNDHVTANITPFCGQVAAGQARDDGSFVGVIQRLRRRNSLPK
jgi:hypothetical protein